MSRVKVCATQTSLSRITQTSWKTMEHHDRPSTTSPLFRIAMDSTGQWRPIIYCARSRDIIHPHEKEKRERERESQKVIERKGRKGETAIGFYDRTTRGLIARNNGLLWPTCRTQKISFSSPKRFPSPFQIPHSFHSSHIASHSRYTALQRVNGRSWSNYPTTWLNRLNKDRKFLKEHEILEIFFYIEEV